MREQGLKQGKTISQRQKRSKQYSIEPANQKTGKYLKKQHISGVLHLGDHLDG
jgi:hypothetical protein